MPDRNRALAGLVAGILLFPGAATMASSVGSDSDSVAVGSDSSGSGTVVINGRPCKIITEKSDSGTGSQSSSVTAGGGDPGSSSAATAGSGSSGNCVILRSPGAGK